MGVVVEFEGDKGWQCDLKETEEQQRTDTSEWGQNSKETNGQPRNSNETKKASGVV